MKILSTHYLSRRAEARAKKIRGWQRRIRDLDRGEDGMAIPGPDVRARVALTRLQVGVDDEITVRKRGKWDARYDVVLETG